jgi:hypothetical protein
MFLIYSKESVYSDSSLLSIQIIQTSRHLKALWDVELHKRRIKSIVRIIFEIIYHLYSDENLRQIVEKSKEKIRVISVVKDSSQNFSFDWVVNFVLITSTAKNFLNRIENFKKFSIYREFLHKDDHISSTKNTINSKDFLIQKKLQVTSIERQTTISTRALSVSSSISKERSIFVSLNITQKSSLLSRDTEEEKILESQLENREFSELSTSSKKSQRIFNFRFVDEVNNQKIDEKTLFTQITSIVDRLSSKISARDDRLIYQTLTRAQTYDQTSRVRSSDDRFQFYHLINLRELFSTQSSSLFTFNSLETSIRSNTNTVLSEK